MIELRDAHRHSRVSVAKQIRRAEKGLSLRVALKVQQQHRTGIHSKAEATASRIAKDANGKLRIYGRPQLATK